MAGGRCPAAVAGWPLAGWPLAGWPVAGVRCPVAGGRCPGPAGKQRKKSIVLYARERGQLMLGIAHLGPGGGKMSFSSPIMKLSPNY